MNYTIAKQYPEDKPRIMIIKPSGNVRIIKNPNYNAEKYQNKSLKKAPAICSHVDLALAIDIDLVETNNIIKTKCLTCQRNLKIKLTTYSLLHEPSNKLCAKKDYLTKKDAETVLNRCRLQARKNRPTRVYHCPKCKNWHLTSNKFYDKKRR